jgi:hypothetical protein
VSPIRTASVTVGRRVQKLGDAGLTGCAWNVEHRQRNAEILRHDLPGGSCQKIGATAGAPRHDEIDRMVRIFFLRSRQPGNEDERE